MEPDILWVGCASCKPAITVKALQRT